MKVREAKAQTISVTRLLAILKAKAQTISLYMTKVISTVRQIALNDPVLKLCSKHE